MGIWARRSKQYPPPPDGQHDGVLVDVIDHGQKESAWGPRHQVQLVFELGPETAGLRDDGKRHVVSAWFTLSLAPSARLLKDLTAWGVVPADDDVDLEALVGEPARLILVHREGREGRVFANVQAILRPDPVRKLIASGDYERKAPGVSAVKSTAAPTRRTGTDDAAGDDIPF
jgi:hypothetical protein